MGGTELEKVMREDLFQSPDCYVLDDLLSAGQKSVRASTRSWVKEALSPIIEDCAQRAVFPEQLIPGLAEIGAFGPCIPQRYGGAGLDAIAYGLMMQEIERGDSGIRSTASVQSALVMGAIFEYGTDAQRVHYLPRLARGELIGCFGLTEPDYGSNPAGMQTRFKAVGDAYLLEGAKAWISNAPLADLAVVWAKDESDRIHGLLVERGLSGFSVEETCGKWSLRTCPTGLLRFDDVRVPKANRLPGRSGLGAPLHCLDAARYGIAWGALGVAMDCYDTALRYAKARVQFGKPIAAHQLQQKKLAEMLTEITKAQLLVFRLGQLKNRDRATTQQISMAKRNNVEMALKVAREARQLLGAAGITDAYPIMRHMMNLESVVTYEGTHDIHLLITGADITGMPAFD